MSGDGAVRWLPELHLAGDWQMAIDTWLLDQAVHRVRHGDGAAPGGAALRFYSWSRATLSLGYHQRPEPHWLELAARGELALVRRPSGGQAVLHGGDLTYALIWPQAPRQRRQAYGLTCRWLQEGFRRLALPLQFGHQGCDRGLASCFASGTAADLVHPDGSKRIGNAQLWRRGVLLQHGSIQLSPPAALWRQVLQEDPPNLAPLPCGRGELINVLQESATALLPWAALPSRRGLEPAEWSAIAARRRQHQLGSGASREPGWQAQADPKAEPTRP